MIDKETYKSLGIFKKISLSIRTLNMERAFFAGTYFSLGMVFLLISVIFLLSNKTVVSPKYGTTVNLFTTENPRYFSSFYASTPVEEFINGLITSGLLRKTNDENYVLDLAEEIVKSDDGLTVNVKLKPNLKFNNGDPISTDDVLFTYNSIIDPRVKAVSKVKYEGLEFEKVDDSNFIIHLKRPYNRIDEVLTLGILEKSIWEKENKDQFILSNNNQNLSGSGLYFIDSIKTEDDGKISSVKLKSNSNYVNQAPFVHEINVNTYATESSLMQNISDNKVDIIFDANETSIENLRNYDKSKIFNINNIELPRITSIYLNQNKVKAFSDKNVRRAIYEIVERKNLIENILSNTATATYDILPGSDLKSDYTFFTRDELKTALAPLASSTIHIAITNNTKQQKIALYLRDLFFEYNIDLDIQTIDANELIQNEIKNRDFEMLIFTTEIESNSDLYAFLHSSQRNSPGLNITSYTSKTLDQEIDNIKSATSSVISDAAIKNIQEEFYREFFYIPLYTSFTNITTKNNLNIDLPTKIMNYKDLTNNIGSFYNQTEHIWTITSNKTSENLIQKIYKKLH